MVLVAAGSAFAGGLCVAWFARPVVRRPTDEQPEQGLAAAVPEFLRAMADAPRAERQREADRAAYLEFLVRVEAAFGAASAGSTAPLAERRAVSEALDALRLVGPADVVEAAQDLTALALADHGSSPDDVERAKATFLNAARSALKPPSFLTPAGKSLPNRVG
ncbi:hypothetical protein [Streptomyces graminilatus]|uniref:hypothetical protein n=1 Tax=Streptomyces graminilatus TaxID=1464070 RepID=UPI0012FEEC4E|nr:hypothetical protein [Streptomyces graminilatus]